MKKRLYINSLFFKIVCAVSAGIICLAVILGAINVNLSKRVFLANFAESQEKIFNQVDLEFYSLYQDIAAIMDKTCSNQSIIRYITSAYEDQYDERQCILDMKKVIDDTEFSSHRGFNIMLAGMSGKTYIHNSSDKLVMQADQILQSDISLKALETPKILASGYREQGFTETMAGYPVVIFAKAIQERGSSEILGIVFLTLKESEIKKLYSAYTSQTSEIMIFNQYEELLSSETPENFQYDRQRKAAAVMREMEEKGLKKMNRVSEEGLKSYQIQRLQNTSYQMLGIIDPEAAFSEEYNILVVILITAGVTVLVAMALFFLVRAQTKPLYRLADTMKRVRDGKLDEYVEVTGTDEVRELSRTYNDMITELNRYIEELIKIQEEKRSAEIHALQMQINPHYMYNTLASIKWLVWQGDGNRAAQVIDAFISLLRNTISNTDEFITVEQEIENLRNYVLINQTRYGDNIRVEFFVPLGCGSYKVPKLILQPFVENAFFHAFPEGRQGSIQIFVKESEGYLKFRIEDDGVGMDMKKLMSLKNKDRKKGEHFTGIGINNVDDRIKMIYGMDYGINIISQEGKGTTVTIHLPLRE